MLFPTVGGRCMRIGSFASNTKRTDRTGDARCSCWAVVPASLCGTGGRHRYWKSTTTTAPNRFKSPFPRLTSSLPVVVPSCNDRIGRQQVGVLRSGAPGRGSVCVDGHARRDQRVDSRIRARLCDRHHKQAATQIVRSDRNRHPRTGLVRSGGSV